MTKEEQIRSLIGGSWYKKIQAEFDKDYMININQVLSKSNYYPAPTEVFRAFMLTPYDEVKVVLLGQDPYHDGQATGLAFETRGKMNASLKNILDGMDEDLALGDYLAHKHNLSYLTGRGVLLLNTSLTVEPNKAGSHTEMWKPFTAAVIQALNEKESPVMFLMWGKHAQSYIKYIDPLKHSIIECEHPAAAAYAKRAWDHKECFSKTLEFIKQNYGEHYSRIW